MKKCILCLIVTIGTITSASAEVVQLAREGKALLPIVVSKDASARVRSASDTLAEYLSQVSKAKFSTKSYAAGGEALFVGLSTDFPGEQFAEMFAPDDPMRREEYLLRSRSGSLWLIGATELAVEHAIWDLLSRFGYRQFFPGESWEFIPKLSQLSIDVDLVERPDYLSRRIWYGYGTWDYNTEPYERWCARNRCVPGLQLNTGHAYDGVVKAKRDEFEAHPEYWPLLNGERKPVRNPKPCLSNPAVRQLFVRYALDKLAAEPTLDSVSMDPSDGGGWCECEQCAKLGTISDQAVTVANEVASAINKEHPGRVVGMYAYNYHSPPPSLSVHPKVVISVATAFLKGGMKLDEVISGWESRGATLGMREYYSVNVWDRDLPASARGGNLEYLRRTIPEFHAKGAKFMSSESSDNWGPNGLGYYLASRMLWDVSEASGIDELTDDFLSKCFGPAHEEMREFYKQLEGSRPHLIFDDQLGRMFRALDSARLKIKSSQELADDERGQINARLDDLTLYARYVDLFDRYRGANGDARQMSFEAMIRHVYRMRQTMMVHAKALYRDVTARDKSVSIPKEATWTVPEERNPWKSSEPFTAAELASYVREGIAGRSLVELDFEPVAFSEDLVPADALKLKSALPLVASRGRGRRSFYTYVEQAPTTLTLQITGGLIAHYRDRGNVKCTLWKLGGSSETGERETLAVSDDSVPPDGEQRTVSLQVKEAGLYRLDVSDGGDITSVVWPAGQRICFKSSLDQPIKTNGRWSLYYYVPKGTQKLGLYAEGHGRIVDPNGQEVLNLEGSKTGYSSLDVPAGTGGQLWSIRNASGSIRLLTVPPYLARSADELLLPREIIQLDSR